MLTSSSVMACSTPVVSNRLTASSTDCVEGYSMLSCIWWPMPSSGTPAVFKPRTSATWKSRLTGLVVAKSLMYSLAVGLAARAACNAIAMYSGPMMSNHGLRRYPSAWDGSIGSLTTSQPGTSLPKWVTSAVMWLCIRWISSARLSAVGVIGLPLASLNTQAGTWLCQTSVWPRTCMSLALAKATSASACAKSMLPSVGSVVSHFMSLPEEMLLKCLLSRKYGSACWMSAGMTAAPMIGKTWATDWWTDGMLRSAIAGVT